MSITGELVALVAHVAESQPKEGASRSETLDSIKTFLERFIAYPTPESATAHVLWIAHTHLIDVLENTPRLAFLSPEPGSGKSRAMELTEVLVPRAVLTVNSTPAYVFRKISDEAGLPTLLQDEADAVFSKKDGNEDLRGLYNSGYRRGATAGRAVIRGREIFTEEFPSFCAVALAGLNQLPDTLMTRSIIVNMKRRRPDQDVEPYRRRVNGEEAACLAGELAALGEELKTELGNPWPVLPESIQDRDADLWEPLIAIADAVGGLWPLMARETAVIMVADAKDKPATLGIKLLSDIRVILTERERLSTHELLDVLIKLELSPWASIKGEPIDSRFLARTLTKYDIETSKSFKINGQVLRGYDRSQFVDAWARYLPPITSETVLPVLPPLPAAYSVLPLKGEVQEYTPAPVPEYNPSTSKVQSTETFRKPDDDGLFRTCYVCEQTTLATADQMAICDSRDGRHVEMFANLKWMRSHP